MKDVSSTITRQIIRELGFNPDSKESEYILNSEFNFSNLDEMKAYVTAFFEMDNAIEDVINLQFDLSEDLELEEFLNINLDDFEIYDDTIDIESFSCQNGSRKIVFRSQE